MAKDVRLGRGESCVSEERKLWANVGKMGQGATFFLKLIRDPKLAEGPRRQDRNLAEFEPIEEGMAVLSGRCFFPWQLGKIRLMRPNSEPSLAKQEAPRTEGQIRFYFHSMGEKRVLVRPWKSEVLEWFDRYSEQFIEIAKNRIYEADAVQRAAVALAREERITSMATYYAELALGWAYDQVAVTQDRTQALAALREAYVKARESIILASAADAVAVAKEEAALRNGGELEAYVRKKELLEDMPEVLARTKKVLAELNDKSPLVTALIQTKRGLL